MNNETFNRLQRVSLILEKGHYAHQSLKLVYIIIAFSSMTAIIVIIELVFFNRRVSFEEILIEKSIGVFFYLLASNESKVVIST